MVKITDELVKHLQELARLKIPDGSVERLKKDMQEILDYMELLNEVDVSDLEPMYTPVEIKAPEREDVPDRFEDVDSIHANFPKEKDGHIVVPGIHR